MFGLQPYLKFIAPAVLAVVALVITGLVQDAWDNQALEVGLFGLASATLSFVITNAPSGVLRYAKALGPPVVALVGIGLHVLFTGEWNDVDTTAALVALASGFVTLVVPNEPLDVEALRREPTVPPGLR